MKMLNEIKLINAVCKHEEFLQYLNLYREEEYTFTQRFIYSVMFLLLKFNIVFVQYNIIYKFASYF